MVTKTGKITADVKAMRAALALEAEGVSKGGAALSASDNGDI